MLEPDESPKLFVTDKLRSYASAPWPSCGGWATVERGSPNIADSSSGWVP